MSAGAAVALAYALVSALAFAHFGWDKHRARRGGPRVPEARLHALALAGGFAGAWLGMRAFRHKTRRPAFHAVAWGAAVLHAAGWAWWLLR